MVRKPVQKTEKQKKIYVSEETQINLFTYKYANKYKNMDEVIKDLLDRSNKNSSK